MKKITKVLPITCGAVLLSCISLPRRTDAINFVALGDLTGGTFSSGASAISSDGRIVVGVSSSSGGSEAFRWTRETGMVGLGDLPGGPFESVPTGTSSDGSVIVGNSKIGDFESRAFRWTEAEGMTMIAVSDEEPVINSAVGVSADGNTILVDVGAFGFPAGALFSVEDERITDEIFLPSDETAWDGGRTTVISADGRSVYGGGIIFPNEWPFRWTKSTGSMLFEGIEGFFVSPGARTAPEDVSPDGTVFVGSSGLSIRSAYRWTEGIGFERLSQIVDSPGVTGSVATRVSGDAQIIIGSATADVSGETGFVSSVWDEVHGWRKIEQLLIDVGIDLSGWQEVAASDISDDGRFIVGGGRNPDGILEAWLVDLSKPKLLPGDYNANNVVEQGDLDLVLLHWGSEFNMFEPPDGWIRNLPSGRVDQAELDAVLLNWGAVQPVAGSAASVPEPRSLLLLAPLAPFLSCIESSRCRRKSRSKGVCHGANFG